MMQSLIQIKVCLEIGKVRTFAIAPERPGWCRSGRDEVSALQVLIDYGPRYALAIQTYKKEFHLPMDVSAFKVVERLAGNATTDFGAPGQLLASDALPASETDLDRWNAILQACWQTFDAAVKRAEGKSLLLGPRGGGRKLEKIIRHVNDANLNYLAKLGEKLKPSDKNNPEEELVRIRQSILETLTASVQGEIPKYGPRGGVRWSPRFFVRRLAWHELDHAWEIEDRTL